MQMKLSGIFFSLLFSLWSLLCAAQTNTSVSVSADKNRILPGEPFVMTIEARFHLKSGTTFLMPDTIAHFEFLEPPVIDSVREGETVRLNGKYKLTSFDSGHWVIPSVVLDGYAKSDTVGIDVVFSDFNPEQPYHDIKDILEPEVTSKRQWWWYIAAGAFLLMLAVIYLHRRKKKLPVKHADSFADPFEEAMMQLQKLQKSNPGSKQFHSALTGIFRLYLFRKKGILSLHKTTDDLLLQLRELNLEKAQFEKLSQVLRLSDFVKFAKYNPSDADNDICFNTIFESIKLFEQSGS
jgi:hypothetical protein